MLKMFCCLQSEHDEIEAKFIEERAALELKYQKLQRYDIVNGVVEVDRLKDEVATDKTDVDSKEGNLCTICSDRTFY